MVPPTCLTKNISGGQQEKGHGVVQHVQSKYHLSSLVNLQGGT